MSVETLNNTVKESKNNYQDVQNMLEKIKENKLTEKFSKLREGFDEEDKESLYNDGGNQFSFTGKFKQSLHLLNPISGPLRSPLIRMFEKKSFKEQFTKDGFDVLSGAVRVCVHLGLLSKPQNISSETLLKNINNDSKYIKRQMWILEKAAMVIPEFRPALPMIQKIKPIVDISADILKDIMTKQIHNQEESDIKNETNKDLKENFG